jgi:hypothetical protein
MRLGHTIFAVLLLSFSPLTSLAAPPGFAFLEIPTGARASALGGAYAALAEGAEAAFWNPAGLEATHGLQMMGGHTEWFEKLRHDHFALAGRMFGGGIAASLRALYSEPIDERDELGNLIGSFGAHDLEFGLAYGRSVGQGLSLGGSAQVIRERISNLAATTYGFGAGMTWEPATWPGLRLAVSGQNLGPAARYTVDGVQGEPVGLPSAVQAGGAYTAALGSRFRVSGALEGRMVRGRSAMTFVGSELTDPSGAALRLGMRFNDSASIMSFGAGYVVSGLSLDYAFVPMRYDLGDTHRFGFTARF